MSYILEALRKAQAERAHGAVPGVHAQPIPTIARQASVARKFWIAGMPVLLLICALLLWKGPWTRPDADAPTTSPPPLAAGVPEAPATQPAPAATPPAPGAVAAPDAAPLAPPAPSKPLRKLGEAAPTDTAAAPPAPLVPAPERIALLQELPAKIQREIPPLAINGYIYASNPADRSVLINNRLRREGDSLSDGLVLEKLLPREMVLNYRGYRYRVSY